MFTENTLVLRGDSMDIKKNFSLSTLLLSVSLFFILILVLYTFIFSKLWIKQENKIIYKNRIHAGRVFFRSDVGYVIEVPESNSLISTYLIKNGKVGRSNNGLFFHTPFGLIGRDENYPMVHLDGTQEKIDKFDAKITLKKDEISFRSLSGYVVTLKDISH